MIPQQWQLGERGKAQAVEVARRLSAWSPFHLFSSHEPKAMQTAEIIAETLGLEHKVFAGLEEFDRPKLPIMNVDEHHQRNRAIFLNQTQPILGVESGNDALKRFDDALFRLHQEYPDDNLAIVTHGTVMSLFLAHYNSTDGFEVWKRLQCGDFVVVSRPNCQWNTHIHT